MVAPQRPGPVCRRISAGASAAARIVGGNMRLLSFGLLGLALALAPCHGAVAQEWPNRPVTMIVPFPAGAAVDTLARAVAHALSEKFGKQFIIDNRADAGGNLGGTAVAKAASGGPTWL